MNKSFDVIAGVSAALVVLLALTSARAAYGRTGIDRGSAASHPDGCGECGVPVFQETLPGGTWTCEPICHCWLQVAKVEETNGWAHYTVTRVECLKFHSLDGYDELCLTFASCSIQPNDLLF